MPFNWKRPSAIVPRVNPQFPRRKIHPSELGINVHSRYHIPAEQTQQKTAQQIILQESARIGKAFHKAVENYVNHKIPMSKEDYQRFEPSLRYMRDRGFAPRVAEKFLTDEFNNMSGYADVIFYRDLDIEPKPELVGQIAGFECVMEIKTQHFWMFEGANRHPGTKEYEKVMAEFLKHVQQVSCYTKMRDKWNTVYNGVTGCISYVDCNKIFLVPKEDEMAYVHQGIEKLTISLR
jgi:hypothetical protein